MSAQAPDEETEEAAENPNVDPEAAGRVFLRAAGAYGSGEYESAAELFQQAYELHPEPALLLNLGLARERAGMVIPAIEAYERFLRERPEADERTEVERSLETLRRQRALEEQIAQREETPAVAPTASGGISVAPWILMGGGVAVLIAGLVIGGVAQARYDEALGASHLAAPTLAQQANDLGLGANILFGVGGTLTLVGLIWGIIDVATQPSAPAGDVAITLFGRPL